MPNFGWHYPAGFNLALLNDPTHCEHDTLIDDPCRKCDGDWDYEGCEHGRPYPVIHYDDQDNPVNNPTGQWEYDNAFPNPNCEECRDEARHNLKCYGTVEGFRHRKELVWPSGGAYLRPARSGL